MFNNLYTKGLVVGIIVLFIGVGIQSTVANEVSVNKEIIKENDTSSDSWGNGIIIIIIRTFRYEFMLRKYIIEPWVRLICEDLDTGEITHMITNFLGFRVRFFQRGHDYRIIGYFGDGQQSITIEDLGFFYYGEIKYWEW